MVGMRMGIDDVADIFFLNAVSGHPVEQIGDIAGQTRIDQRIDAAADVKTVAVVFIRIGPLVKINIVF